MRRDGESRVRIAAEADGIEAAVDGVFAKAEPARAVGVRLRDE